MVNILALWKPQCSTGAAGRAWATGTHIPTKRWLCCLLVKDSNHIFGMVGFSGSRVELKKVLANVTSLYLFPFFLVNLWDWITWHHLSLFPFKPKLRFVQMTIAQNRRLEASWIWADGSNLSRCFFETTKNAVHKTLHRNTIYMIYIYICVYIYMDMYLHIYIIFVCSNMFNLFCSSVCETNNNYLICIQKTTCGVGFPTPHFFRGLQPNNHLVPGGDTAGKPGKPFQLTAW